MTTVAAIQLCARQDVDDNLHRATALVRDAHALGAAVVALPENFSYIGGLAEKVKLSESLDDPGPILTQLRQLAVELNLHLLLGGMPIRSRTKNRFHNTAIWIAPNGTFAASYRKIHLFDINISEGPTFSESSYVVPGEVDQTPIVTAEGLRFGLSVCYDLRFPEFYRRLALAGVDILCVPAAFTAHTGKNHWMPLLRARAIENQSYVLAPAQWGEHLPGRTSHGHSCIIDPWGVTIAQAESRDAVVSAEINLDHLQRIRRQMPCLSHRLLF